MISSTSTTASLTCSSVCSTDSSIFSSISFASGASSKTGFALISTGTISSAVPSSMLFSAPSSMTPAYTPAPTDPSKSNEPMVDERLSMKSEVTMEDVSIAEVKPCSNDGSGKRRRLLANFALEFDAFGRDTSCELVRLGVTKECGEGVNASVAVAVAKIAAAIEVGIDIILTVFSWFQSDDVSLSSYRLSKDDQIPRGP
mmetsp:Transcript_28519/g.59962  ORF Transcript_28519/g.59962 Transcript_28519/m.59962 type:complete len:200 (+) Transcript_28519:770-1369(+)